MTRKNINISHLFYTLIYAKAVPINSYLLCTSVYIVIVFLSATSFIGAPIISLSLIYRISCIIFSLKRISFDEIYLDEDLLEGMSRPLNKEERNKLIKKAAQY